MDILRCECCGVIIAHWMYNTEDGKYLCIDCNFKHGLLNKLNEISIAINELKDTMRN